MTNKNKSVLSTVKIALDLEGIVYRRIYEREGDVGFQTIVIWCIGKIDSGHIREVMKTMNFVDEDLFVHGEKYFTYIFKRSL